MVEKKVTLRVYGMTCDDCVRSVSHGLSEAGATDISISLKDGIALLKVDDTKISPESLARIPVFGEKSHYRAQIRKVE
jgi:copper chaperone